MVSYGPCTLFDSTVMKVQTIGGAPDSAGDHERRRIQICVKASIFAHLVRELRDNTSVAETTVSATSFISRNQNKTGIPAYCQSSGYFVRGL